MMENTTNKLREKRITNLIKANQIKYSGYPTLIHALPEKVRARLDSYLDHNWPSMVCLRKVCSEFPSVRLPSYKVVQNYRKKYHVLGSQYQETLQVGNKHLVDSYNYIKERLYRMK